MNAKPKHSRRYAHADDYGNVKDTKHWAAEIQLVQTLSSAVLEFVYSILIVIRTTSV